MSLLTWNFDKNFIYVIIYWILEIIYRIVFYEKDDYLKMTMDIVHDEYLIVILLNIADLLSGFLVLHNKLLMKSKKEEKKEERSKSQSELIYDKSFTTLKKTFYKKLITVTLLDYISRSSFWIAFAITRAKLNEIYFTLQRNLTIFIDIIMRYIFAVCILKIVIYKHRIFSLITICIGFAILIINDTILMLSNNPENNKYEQYSISKTFFYSAIASISGFAYPLEDTFVKKIFSEEYLQPASMQFYRGIAEFIVILVITPILYFSFGVNLKVNSDNLIIVIVTISLCTLAAFVKAYILVKIIYHYSFQSVSFLIISQSLGGSITRFIDIFKEEISIAGWKIFVIFLEIICILTVLFASLVYDEIIIINKCDLNKNVKLGIINRAELEMETISTLAENEMDDDQFIDNDNNNNEILSFDNATNLLNQNEDNKILSKSCKY